MSEFQVTFVVGAKALGDVLTALHAFKIDGLDLRPVVKRGAHGKPGGVPAAQVVAQCVAAAKTAVRARDVAAALVAAGYSKQGASTHLASAVKAGLVKKTAKGYVKGRDQ